MTHNDPLQEPQVTTSSSSNLSRTPLLGACAALWLLLASLLIGQTARAQGIQVIDDVNFLGLDWRVTCHECTAGASFSSEHATAYGNPPPCRTIENVMPAPAGYGARTTVNALHEYSPESYTIREHGPVQAIRLQMDAKVLFVFPSAADAGNQVSFRFAVFQNRIPYFQHSGTEFVTYYATGGEPWTTFDTGNLTASQFRTPSSAAPSQPDFSDAGLPLTFGFMCSTSNLATSGLYETKKLCAVDNFLVHVEALDENDDSDGDGVYDQWEDLGIPYTATDGTIQRLLLPQADKYKANLWIEIDLVDGVDLSESALADLNLIFLGSPFKTGSPSVQKGIILHVEQDPVKVLDFPETWVEFDASHPWPNNLLTLRNALFGTFAERHGDPGILQAKAKAYRWGFVCKRLRSGAAGLASGIGGDEFIIAAAAQPDSTEELDTILHELGHCLGLDHGGGDGINGKPNYPSVMNYMQPREKRRIDFTRSPPDGAPAFQPLDELCLNEHTGIGRTGTHYSHMYMPYMTTELKLSIGPSGILEPRFVKSIRYVRLNGERTDFGNPTLSGLLDGSYDSCVRQNLNDFSSLPIFRSTPWMHQELQEWHTRPTPLAPHDDWANVQLPTASARELLQRESSLAGRWRAPAALDPAEEWTTEQIGWARRNINPPDWRSLPDFTYENTYISQTTPIPFAATTKMHQVFAASLFREQMREGATAVRIMGVALNTETLTGLATTITNLRVRLGYTRRMPGAPPPTGLSIPDTFPPNASSPMELCFAADEFRISLVPPFIGSYSPSSAEMIEWRMQNFRIEFVGAPFDYNPALGNLLVEIDSTTPQYVNNQVNPLCDVSMFLPTDRYGDRPVQNLTSRAYKSNLPGFPSMAAPYQANRMKFLIQSILQTAEADGGDDFSVNERQLVVLDGWASSGSGALTYAWTQLSGGSSVTLAGADTAAPSFIAPFVAPGGETLTFQLTVTSDGQVDSDTVNVTIVNVNHTPVANAGSDQSVVEGAAVELDGTASFDIDNDPIAYAWVQVSGTPVVELAGAQSARPTLTAPRVPLGGSSTALVFELRIDDGFPPDAPAPGYDFASVADRVTVEVTRVNNDPVASAGLDQTVDENTSVNLDGRGSTDPDGDLLSYAWVQTDGPVVNLVGATSSAASFIAPFVIPGGTDLRFTLIVNDGNGGADTSTVVVHVQNANDPPLASAARPSVGVLWPPNHKLVTVRIEGVTDPDNNAVISIWRVTQDEPTSGLGDGDTPVDAIINPDGTVQLRAERSGTGDGRVYRIYFVAADLEGTVPGVVVVHVPHQKPAVPAVDSGGVHDSTN